MEDNGDCVYRSLIIYNLLKNDGAIRVKGICKSYGEDYEHYWVELNGYVLDTDLPKEDYYRYNKVINVQVISEVSNKFDELYFKDKTNFIYFKKAYGIRSKNQLNKIDKNILFYYNSKFRIYNYNNQFCYQLRKNVMNINHDILTRK